MYSDKYSKLMFSHGVRIFEGKGSLWDNTQWREYGKTKKNEYEFTKFIVIFSISFEIMVYNQGKTFC